jgi:uncharacterized membrane protein YbaN (DUF454 family)
MAMTGGGFLMLSLGLLLVVLPGPSLLFIVLGLAILARDFPWAQRWLSRLRDLMERMKRLVRDR